MHFCQSLLCSVRAALLLVGIVVSTTGGAAAVGPKTSWYYDPWRTDSGLPNNDVTSIVQTEDGALLIGTPSCLSRFDGLRFKACELFSMPLVGGDSILAMCAGDQGITWVISRGRLIAWKEGEVVRTITFSKAVSDSRPTSMLYAAQDTLWITTDEGRLFRLVDGELKPVLRAQGQPEMDMHHLTQDARGQIWASGSEALMRWNGAHMVKVAAIPAGRTPLCASRDGGLWLAQGMTLYRYTEESGLKSVQEIPSLQEKSKATVLMEDSSGRVWFGSSMAGLFTWKDHEVERINVSHHDVRCLMEDAEHNLWVGTGGNGIVRVRQRILKILDERRGPIFCTPQSLCMDARGDIWVVIQGGDVYVRRSGVWTRLRLEEDLRTQGASCVVADDKGSVWIACRENKLVHWDGRVFHDEPLPPSKRSFTRIQSLLVGRDGQIWGGRGWGEIVHGQSGKWELMQAEDVQGTFICLAQDRTGVIWAATNGGRLFKIEEGLFTAQSLAGSIGPIYTMLPTPDGALWLGRERRIERLKNGEIAKVDNSNGLDASIISLLTLDDRGRMWLGTEQGMLLAPLEELERVVGNPNLKTHFSQYTTGGYQTSTNWHPASAVAPGGWLWYCSRAGVMIANMNVAGSNLAPPRVSIEAVNVNNQAEKIRSGMQFGPGPAEINFELAVFSFRFPELVSVMHKIDGVDADWITTGKDRMAHYPRLPPGHHVLRVRAVNEDGVSSRGDAILAFDVIPSFWETRLFVILVAGVGVISAFGLARFYILRRMRRETEKLREQAAVNGERVRISRDMHDQLGASLTQISLITDLMAAEGSHDSKRLEQLARTARQASTSLDEIVWAVNPRHDHLGSVLEYLGQQAVNLAETAGLRCRLDLPPETPDRHLPADFRHQVFLIVREAINNIIKHASAREVMMSAMITPHELHLSISDDGCGGAANAAGNGLQNMRSRAEALHGDCQILSMAGGGTTVALRLPWPRTPRSS